MWARAARRRLDAALTPPVDMVDEADKLVDLGQAIEALDRALRHADRILGAVEGTALPAAIDWDHIRTFARRGRDALAHSDERLAEPGLGYFLRRDQTTISLFGKARGEKSHRLDQLGTKDLVEAIDELTAWFDSESSIS